MGYGRTQLQAIYGLKCFYCGTTKGKASVDHVTPTSLGGGNNLGNKVIACVDCNNIKGNRTAEEFVAEFSERIRPDFSFLYEFRSMLDSTVIDRCVICDVEYEREFSSTAQFCGKVCKVLGSQVRRRIYHANPEYAEAFFASGKQFPAHVYKEFL